jgi:hypothetical protein
MLSIHPLSPALRRPQCPAQQLPHPPTPTPTLPTPPPSPVAPATSTAPWCAFPQADRACIESKRMGLGNVEEMFFPSPTFCQEESSSEDDRPLSLTIPSPPGEGVETPLGWAKDNGALGMSGWDLSWGVGVLAKVRSVPPVSLWAV